MPEGASIALDALAEAGFRTERTNPAWLFKAFRDDVVAGVPPDLFKGYVKQLQEFGYTQQQAEQEVTKFFRTIREVAKPGTAEWNKMFEFTGGDPRSVAFFRDIARMTDRGEFGAALTRVAQKGNEIFRR